jgi:hypothetical protein
MSKPVGVEWAPAGSNVFDVDALATRYTRVLLSRRVLRAFAAGTLSAALLLLVVSVVVPLGIALTAAGAENRSAWWLVLVAFLVLVGAAGAAGLVVLYVRALSALARGSRPVIAAVVIVAGIWIAFVGFSDLMSAIVPEAGAPLYFFAYGAFVIHVLMAGGVMIGPLEMRRADAFSRSVFADPRLGTGFVAEVAKLLDLPDVRAFARSGRAKAWLLVFFSLALEGLAFQTLLRWGLRLSDMAERQGPASISAIRSAILVPGAILFLLATLAFSFWLIRLMLIGARRLRLKARRIAMQSADEVVAADSRPPVLFLRSFEEEQVPLSAARLPLLLRGFDPGTEYRTLEEMIVLNLTYVGPVVAVADPSRGELPVGAARWRVKDEEWQQFVERQIRRAALIVVGVSDTDGLRWEMDALKRTPGALGKTIFMCPPDVTRNQALMSDLAGVLGLSDGFGQVPAETYILAATFAGASPTWFITSALSEVTYYVAMRACLVRFNHAPAAAREPVAV